jgi:hypothetical protein
MNNYHHVSSATSRTHVEYDADNYHSQNFASAEHSDVHYNYTLNDAALSLDDVLMQSGSDFRYSSMNSINVDFCPSFTDYNNAGHGGVVDKYVAVASSSEYVTSHVDDGNVIVGHGTYLSEEQHHRQLLNNEA